LTRRSILVGGAGVAAGVATGALSGCTVFGRKPARPTATATPDPAELALERAVESETSLLAAYDATIAAYPALEGQLAPMRADHVAHLEALRPASASPTPQESPSTSPTPQVPRDANAAVADLVSFEHAAAADRVHDLGPLPARLAQLLASIGGSEAAHAALLTVAK
jgi:hypothetical protein